MPLVFGSKVLRLYNGQNHSYVAYYESLTDPRHTLLVILSDKTKPEAYCRQKDESVFIDFLTDISSKNSSYSLPIFPEKTAKILVNAIDAILDNHISKSEEEWNLHFMRSHLNAYLNRETLYIDGQGMNFDELKQLVDSNYRMHLQEKNVPRSNFYLGITNDVDVRIADHEEKENTIISKAIAVLCDSNELAVKVEEDLGKRSNGFDNGNPTTISHGKPENTRFLYMYKRIKK